MSTAFPCATTSNAVLGIAATHSADRNNTEATLRSPDCREQRLRVDVPENAEHDSAFRREQGALTPEACTDGDNDSSDDERRGLHKTPALGAEARAPNRYVFVCFGYFRKIKHSQPRVCVLCTCCHCSYMNVEPLAAAHKVTVVESLKASEHLCFSK